VYESQDSRKVVREKMIYTLGSQLVETDMDTVLQTGISAVFVVNENQSRSVLDELSLNVELDRSLSDICFCKVESQQDCLYISMAGKPDVTSEQYRELVAEMNGIYEKYPNVRAVMDSTEPRSLTVEECKGLLAVIDIRETFWSMESEKIYSREATSQVAVPILRLIVLVPIPHGIQNRFQTVGQFGQGIFHMAGLPGRRSGSPARFLPSGGAGQSALSAKYSNIKVEYPKRSE